MSTTGFLVESLARLAIDDEITLDLGQDGSHAAKVVWECDNHYGCDFTVSLRNAILSSTILRSEASNTLDDRTKSTKVVSNIHDTDRFGRMLATRRNILAMTQTDLAKVIGVSKTTICKWERGHVRPRPKAFARIEEVLGVLPGKNADVVEKGGSEQTQAQIGQAEEERSQGCKKLIAEMLGLPACKIEILIRI